VTSSRFIFVTLIVAVFVLRLRFLLRAVRSGKFALRQVAAVSNNISANKKASELAPTGRLNVDRRFPHFWESIKFVRSSNIRPQENPLPAACQIYFLARFPSPENSLK
jgi:hypothetical protein